MQRNTQPGRGKAIGLVAAGLAAILALSMGALALGGSQAGATASDGGEPHDNSQHRSGRGKEDPEDLALCFASTMDQVGRGNVEAAVELIDPCLADNYTFEFQFSADSPAIVCPGSDCPVTEYTSRADMRTKFAQAFFVDAGYQATQHQMLNIDATPHGKNYTEVVAYIQANHFLANNSVDIAWNDYKLQAVRNGDRWLMQRETIVGTAFLNFEGGVIGGGDSGGGEEAAPAALLPVGADVTLRNTLEETGSPETAFPALFGAPDNLFDEFSTLTDSGPEFATALAQPGTPVGDISGLYEIDMTATSIDFTLLPTADDPFWVNVFELFPEGKFDRYYFTFSEPHNVSGFTSSHPSVALRVDSPTVIVVEFSEGYDMAPGAAVTIDLD